jgi:hypothetical protein
MMIRNRKRMLSPTQAIPSSLKLVELRKTRVGNSKVNVDQLIAYPPIVTLAVVPDNKRYQVTEKNCEEIDSDSLESGDDENEKA